MAKFNEIYENVYKECQEPLEKLRKKEQKKLMVMAIIVFVIGMVITHRVKMKYQIEIRNIITIMGTIITISTIVAIYFLLKKKSDYNDIFKVKIIKKFVTEYNENLYFYAGGGISPTTYNKGEFEQQYDRYHSEDSIEGIIGENCKIHMSEVHTRNQADNISFTIFHGLFVEVEMDKSITNTMKIRKNKINLLDKKEKVEMDSGEFEKIYDIYSENKIIAMQLFTSDIMQMFVDFKRKNEITPELTIKENYIYIRFDTGEIFESNIFKRALDYSALKKYYDTIEFTLRITEKMLKNITETEI